MSVSKKYKLLCETEDDYVFTISDKIPMICPNNSGHAINIDSIRIVDSKPLGKIMEIAEISEPLTPTLDKHLVYFDSSDSLLKTKDSAGIIKKYYGSKTNLLYVSKLGESDFTTIKEAVEHANSLLPATKSAIVVQPGTYIEMNTITIGSGISVVSAGGPNSTIIVGAIPNQAIWALGQRSLLQGFTITGAYLSGGSGIYFDGSQVGGNGATVKNCVILNCDIGAHSQFGSSILFLNETAFAAQPTSTINIAMHASDGGQILSADCACIGIPIQKIGVGYCSTGNSGSASLLATMGGTLDNCTTGIKVNDDADLQIYMLRIVDNDTAVSIGASGTATQLTLNNTSISNSTTYDLEILSTAVNIHSMSTKLDDTKINNPNDVPLKIFTSRDDGSQHIYSDMYFKSTVDFASSSVINLSHTSLDDIGTNTHAQIDTHIASVSNPHTVTKAQIGLNNVLDTKVNINGIISPTVADDINNGYTSGSSWLINDRAYVCVDASSGAATWIETTQVASGSDGKVQIASGGRLSDGDLVWDSGKLAIGKTSAVECLDVSGSAVFADSLYFGDSTSDGSWRMRISGSSFVIEKKETTYWINKHTFLDI